METYRKILTHNKSEASAHYHIGLLLNAQGRWHEAVSHYAKADRLMAYPPEVKYDYANILFRAGEVNAAEKKYDEFLLLGQTVAMAYNNKGLVLASQGRLREAQKHFEQALRIVPSLQVAANNLRLATQQLREGEEKQSDEANKQ